MVIDEIVDHVVTLLALRVVLFRVINRVISTDRSDQVNVIRAADAGYLCAKCLGDLHGKCPDASGGAIDQDLVPCFDMACVAQALQSNKCGRDRRSLFETEVARFGNHCSVPPDADVLGESACPYSKHFLARLKLGHVHANGFNRSGKVRSRDSVSRFTKSEDEPAETALQHAPVEKSEGNGANTDENLVVVGDRL